MLQSLYQLIISKDIYPHGNSKIRNSKLSHHLDINDYAKCFFKICLKTATNTSLKCLQIITERKIVLFLMMSVLFAKKMWKRSRMYF